MIAMCDQLTEKQNENITYTHCEIHPTLALGALGSIIPFADSNQFQETYFQQVNLNRLLVYILQFQKSYGYRWTNYILWSKSFIKNTI